MLKRITALAFIVLMALPFSKIFANSSVDSVMFQVDMGIQMQLGNFIPAQDSVVVRGDFESYLGQGNWSGAYFLLSPSKANDSIYTLTIPFPADSLKTADFLAQGGKINYKFVVLVPGQGDQWENTASGNNRSDSITTAANQIIPLVYFSDKSSTGTIATVNITFEADMTSLLNNGYNPAVDSIEVRGDTPPLNWGPGANLTQDLSNPALFKVTLSFTGTVGSTINWKYHCDPQSNFANTGWENIANNRVLIFPSADTTVGPIAPVIILGGTSTGADTITFQVNMNGAREKYHNSLITGLKSVWIGGSVSPLTWPSNWLFSDTVSGGALIKLYDDGSAAHGDVTANDGIYSVILVFPAGSISPVFYKYGADFSGVDTLNGGASYMDNEAAYALNHTLNLNLSGGHAVVVNKFGDQATGVVQQKTNLLPKKYMLSQNYPNPFNPSTNISYDLPNSGNVTLKIYNILGQEVATVFQGFQKAGSYIANFNASRLASGVYFYRLQAGQFSEAKKMLLMK
jgi:hypothetical protein